MKNTETKNFSRRIGNILQRGLAREEFGPVLALLLTVFLAWIIIGPGFFSSYNIFSTIRQFCFIGIVALGELLVIMIAGIDLSVGAVASISGLMSAWFMANTGIDPYLCLFGGVLIGIIVGFLNGILITKLSINPFIITLGTMKIYFSANMIITEGWPITNISKDIVWLGQGKVSFLPVPGVILLILTLILGILLSKHRIGRKLYSIGNNARASLLCGVKVDRIRLITYTLSGFFAAIAGILSMARLNSGQPTLGEGWELQAIAAVVIGGGSLSGGRGTPLGTLMGAAIVGIINQIIVLSSLSSFWQKVIVGLVIILAVLFDKYRKKFRK